MLRPTSRITHFYIKKNQGYTLIEVMIVVAIIGGMMTIAVQKLSSNNSNVRATIRKLSVYTRQLQNSARLSSRTYRLVLDLKEDKPHTYWVESAKGSVFFDAKKEEDLENAKKQDEKIQVPFTPDHSFTKKAMELPKGLFFKDIQYGNRSEIINSGKAYIYFMPGGLSDEAIIHVTDKKQLIWSIVVNPLTGNSAVISSDITVKDLPRE